MVFTAGERRLLAVLILFLAAGYLISALRHAGMLDWLSSEGAAGTSTQAAAGIESDAADTNAAGGEPADASGSIEDGARAAGATAQAGAPYGGEGILLAGAPAESLFAGGFLDLNRADSAALVALPGIGPALAGRIVAERSRSGGFRSVDDLDRVRGIGPQKLERLRGLVTVAGR